MISHRPPFGMRVLRKGKIVVGKAGCNFDLALPSSNF